MNVWIFRLILVLGVLGGAYGAILAIKHWGAVEEREKIALADKAKMEEKWAESFNLSSALEKELAARDAANQKLKEDLDAEISKNGVYAACRLPADGLRLYNAALAGSPAR